MNNKEANEKKLLGVTINKDPENILKIYAALPGTYFMP